MSGFLTGLHCQGGYIGGTRRPCWFFEVFLWISLADGQIGPCSFCKLFMYVLGRLWVDTYCPLFNWTVINIGHNFVGTATVPINSVAGARLLYKALLLGLEKTWNGYSFSCRSCYVGRENWAFYESWQYLKGFYALDIVRRVLGERDSL